ncbi:hypothetical protein PMAYCL1PPCAC_11454, partial [Pristionchus mayeri]
MSLQQLLSSDDESFDVIDQSNDDRVCSFSGSEVSVGGRTVKEDETGGSTPANKEIEEERSLYRRELDLLDKESFAVLTIADCSKQVQSLVDLQQKYASYAEKLDDEMGQLQLQLEEKEERLADLRDQIKMNRKQQEPLLSVVGNIDVTK